MGLAQKAEIFVEAVDVATVRDWLDHNEILLVDVRETKEYEVEHIPGALLLPLSSFDPDTFPVLPGKKIVLHCAIGKRSEAAGKMLLKAGYRDIVHMAGGMSAWKEARFEVEAQILPPAGETSPPAPVFLCPTPGHVLQDEFLQPLGISSSVLATRLGVSDQTLSRLLEGDVKVDAELSLRLARYFSTAADFWLHLQIEHDLERARHAVGEQIRREIRPRAS